MADSKLLSPEEFRTLLAEALELEAARLTPEASFADLGVDSLRMVGLLLRLQQEGYDLPPELAWNLKTVEEAYEYYVGEAMRAGIGD